MSPSYIKYNSGLHRSFLGRRQILIAEIWGWCSKPILPLLKRKGLALSFNFKGIRPITNRTSQQADSILEDLKFELKAFQEKYPQIQNIDGLYLRILMEVIHVLMLDMPPINPRIINDPIYQEVKSSIETVICFLDTRLSDQDTDSVLELVSSYILNVIWESEDKFCIKPTYWYKGLYYDKPEFWLEAVRLSHQSIPSIIEEEGE